MSIPLKKQILVHEHIRQMIDFLREKGHDNVRLLCHDHRDIPFAASFADVEYVYLDDIYTYLSMLNACELNVTYRLHSALPCLSFGRPVINISYDERALSLIRTIGYEEWNIDMVMSADVVGRVKDRYARLGELPALRRQTTPVWNGLDKIMGDTFRSFAKEVTAYHRQNQ